MVKGLRSPNGSGDASTPVVRRNKALGIGLGAVVVASLLSWAAASRVRSPAEIAARTAPPKPSLISVPVERRVLSSEVVVRGTVRYGAPQEVALPVSALKNRTGIVTTPVVKGRDLREGGVALSISGRPVFVLQGAQPAYRDMGPGAKGEDVRQLEQALVRLGFQPGPPDGVYDARTGAAVAAWYERSGWTPLAPTQEQLEALRSAEADWYAAQSEVLQAQEGLAVSERDLVSARQRAETPAVPPLPPTPPSPTPPAATDAAAPEQAQQERVAAAVTAAVDSLKQLLDLAIEEERAAQTSLEEARAKKAKKKEVTELERASQEASDRVAVIREQLATAEEAAAAIVAAASEVTPPTGPEAPSAADAAREATLAAREAALAAREATLEEITSRAEVDKATTATDFARRRVDLMLKWAGSILGATTPGIHVPADEVLFFPSLPLRVDDTKLRPGEEVAGAVMTVTNSRLVIESAVTANDAKLVRQGAPVAIRAPDLGIDATGTVTQVATTAGTNGVDPQRFYLEVTPTDVAPALVGASVVQTITVGSTQGEVLAVPAAALSVSADGGTRLVVQRANGTTQPVRVTPGLAAKGLVAVTPIGDRLGPGDLVVVGRDGPPGPVKSPPPPDTNTGALGFWGPHGR